MQTYLSEKLGKVKSKLLKILCLDYQKVRKPKHCNTYKGVLQKSKKMSGPSCQSIVWNATPKPITLSFETWSLRSGLLKSGTCWLMVPPRSGNSNTSNAVNPTLPLTDLCKTPFCYYFHHTTTLPLLISVALHKVVDMSLHTKGMFARIKLFFYTRFLFFLDKEDNLCRL